MVTYILLGEDIFMYKIRIIFIFISLFILSSCCYATEKNSLDEYKNKIVSNEFGFSDIELDKPMYFLPSNTFLDDYEYLEGDY